ncbi:MAG: histidine phosphatase family protein [Betaproteobacteria bacterium]|nr:histidine phosphatase family protein [Betaproteobacteria bacterium]
MDLILWRHADAEDGAPDRARKLTPKGERQAERVARWLDKHLGARRRILASPARRAQQTAAALAGDFETHTALEVGASARSVLAAAGWPGDEDSVVVLVGHQPTLGEAAALALAGHTAAVHLKKGAFVWIAAREAATEVTLRAALAPDLL